MIEQVEKANPRRDKETSPQKLETTIRAIASLSIEVPDPKDKGRSIPITFSEQELRKAHWLQGRRFSQETISRIVPERFRENILNLGIDPIRWKRIVLRQTLLLTERPETVLSNIVTTALAIGIPPMKYLKAAKRNPGLFCRVPDSIVQHLVKSAQLFHTSQDVLTSRFIAHPEVFSHAPETMHGHVEEAARRIGLARDEYFSLALQNPFLFRYHPDRVQYNVEEGAKLLGIEKTTYVGMVTKAVGLLKQAPLTTQNKFELYQIFFEKNRAEVVQTLIANPRLLTVAPERLFAHYAIAKLRNEKEVPLSWHILKSHPLKYAKKVLTDDEYGRFRSAFEYLVRLSAKRRTIRRKLDPKKETLSYWEHADFIDRYFGQSGVPLDAQARLNIQKLFDTVISHMGKQGLVSPNSKA